MKKKSMLKVILILIGLFGYTVASAQSDYIVLIGGDTLYGKVTHFSHGFNQRVQLIDNTKKKSAYTIMQVKGFQMKDEIYRLVKFQETYTFMKLITPGYLSLYKFQLENQLSWDGRYLLKIDGGGIEVPNLGFKKRVSDLLSDCQDVSEKITDGTLGRNDLDEIITEYNSCITRRTEQKVLSGNRGKWTKLEAAVKSNDQLADKDTILEMITEIQSKQQRSERIPNFLSEGLKKLLEGNDELTELLNKALATDN